MDELLKTLDESVFTPELTQKIQDMFESKVSKISEEYEEKAQILETKATEYAQLVVEEYEEKAQILEAKATEYAEYVKEELEAKTTEYAEYVKEELTSTMSAFLDVVVEEYVDENRLAVDSSIEAAKLKAVLEGFDSLLVTTGVSISQIADAKVEGSSESEMASLKESVSKLIKENAKLKADMGLLSQKAIVEKLSVDMNLAQKDKFEKLVETVTYSNDIEAYEAKLNTIAETISKKEEAKPEKTLTESKTIVTSVSSDSYKRFI